MQRSEALCFELDRFELYSFPPGGAYHQAQRVKEGPKEPNGLKRAQKAPKGPKGAKTGQNTAKIARKLARKAKISTLGAQLCAWLVPAAAYWS